MSEAPETPVVDAQHASAMDQLRREGHIWGQWFPHRKNQVYRACVVGTCSEVQIKTVKS